MQALRRLLVTLTPVVLVCAAPTTRAAPRTPTDTVVFHLHKWMQDVGTERDTWVPTATGGVEAKAVFAFRDRLSTVSLAASWETGAAGELVRYAAWGATSRWTTLDDRVEARGDGSFRVSRLSRPEVVARPTTPFVAASGYAPALSADVLLRAWGKAGRPRTLALLPEGTATVESRGPETFVDDAKKTRTLEHIAIAGRVWGREDAWLDDHGTLAAIVTRDAEFDPFEAVRDDLVALLPDFTARAGTDGASAFSRAVTAAPGFPDSGPVALVGGRLIDGTGRAAVEDAVVVLDGARIVAAGPRSKTPVPPGVATVGVSGKTILPGLWDMHAHYSQVEQGPVYLAAGVTTVRDLGNVLDFIVGVRDAIDAGKGLGPRILVSGLVDGEGGAALGTLRIRRPDEVGPVLDRLVQAGCLQVKLYSSIAPELVPLIAREAHRRRLGVTGHVPQGMTAQQALDAGFDAIDHLFYLFNDPMRLQDFAKLSPEARYAREAGYDLGSPSMLKLYRTLERTHAWVDDTIALSEEGSFTDEAYATREPGVAKVAPDVRGMIEGVEPKYAAQAAAAFAHELDLLRELHKRGVPIVAGTDIAVPGHSLHRELELYVQAGFTPMEAIQAATSVPARLMKLDQQVGTVEPGKRADLIVVDGDPLTDIHSIRKVSVVIARGKAHAPARLWPLAGFTP